MVPGQEASEYNLGMFCNLCKTLHLSRRYKLFLLTLTPTLQQNSIATQRKYCLLYSDKDSTSCVFKCNMCGKGEDSI